MTSADVLQVIIDIAAVFLGVSLSFWVENRREQWRENRAAKQMLLGIRQDIAAELSAVQRFINVLIPSAEAAHALYRDWRDLSANLEKAQRTFYLLHMGAMFTPSRAHYETAKSTGSLGFITDDSLRSLLGSVFEQQHAYLTGMSSASAQFDFEFFRQLRAYVEYHESTELIETYVIRGKASPPVSIALLPNTIDRLAEDDVTRNSMHLMATFRGYLAGLLESHSKTLRDLDAAIERYVII